MDLSAFLAVLTGLQAGSDLISKIERTLRGRLDWDRLWRDTEACFEAALHEEERRNLRDLPIRELSSIKEAFEELHRSGSTGECSAAAKAVLERDWQIASEARLDDLAEAYCDCARRALLAQSFKDQPGFLLVASALFDLGKVIRNGANRGVTLDVSNYGDNVERFLDFYLYEERVFVGREDELNALRQKVMGQERGFAFVSAPAGKGKSALLSRLWLGIHLSPRPGVKVVFIPISTRFGTATKKAFYERLAHELSVVYGIEKPEAGSEVEALRHYTQSLLSQPPDERLKLVVIVDGLDEATDWNPIKEPPFPLRLGDQIRLVLSARTMPDYPNAASWSATLGLPLNRVLSLNLGNLSEADVRRALAEAYLPEIAPEDAEAVASELYRLTEEGDPLLLDLYLDALNPQGGGIPKLTASELNNIAPGYEGYFKRWLGALEDRLRHQGLGDLSDLAITIFTLLSYAKGPLSRVDLGVVVRFWHAMKGQNDAHFSVRFEKILEHGNRLLAGDDEALSLAHPRLGEFFQQKYGVHEPDFERTYVNWGLSAWHKAKTTTGNRTAQPLPRYLLEHFSSHLADLGMLDELAELVVDPIWFRQSREHDGTLRLLAQDLNRLLDLAMEQEKRLDIWTTDVFYLNRLHGNANNLPSAIFDYFGKAKRTPEALRWIELITDEEKRGEALTALAGALSPYEIHTFSDTLIKLTHPLGNTGSARVLALIAERLAEIDPEKAQKVAEEALTAARGIKSNYDKAQALPKVARALAEIDEERARDVAGEALEAARGIENRRARADALPKVARALAEVDAEKALEVARGIWDDWARADALAEVARALAEVDAEKALEVARGIEDDKVRAKTLAEVAGALTEVDAEKAREVAGEALEVARGIENTKVIRAKTLAEVARALTEVDAEKAREVAGETLEVARGIENNLARAGALAEVARALTEVDAEKALEVARGIENNWDRADALAEVARALAEVDAEKALEVARGIENNKVRAKTLAEVAGALTEVDAEKAQRAFVDASSSARVSGMTWDWLKEAYPTLAAIAPEKVTRSHDRLKKIQKLLKNL